MANNDNTMGSRRAKMDRANRAKQFMPFDAVKGLREALAQKERIIVPKRELSEEQKEELDWRIAQLHTKDMVTVTYFQDGEYLQATGMIAAVDTTRRILKLVNRQIPFDDIAELACDASC